MDRPTREQVDTLRAVLRTALDEVDHPNLITVDQDALIEILDRLDEQEEGHAAEVRALRAEMERHAAEAHQQAGLASRLRDDLDEARAALAARTPQTAGPRALEHYSVVAFDSPPAWCDEPRTRGLGKEWDERVVELLDSAPDRERCWRCGTGVGFVVAGESDELARWVFAALVSGPGTDAVSVQCEECSPDALPTPWVDPPAAPLPAVPDGSVTLDELSQPDPSLALVTDRDAALARMVDAAARWPEGSDAYIVPVPLGWLRALSVPADPNGRLARPVRLEPCDCGHPRGEHTGHEDGDGECERDDCECGVYEARGWE